MIDKAIGAAFVFFSLFPFLAIIESPTDTQPYALLLGTFWVCLKLRDAPKRIIVLLIYPVCGLALFVFVSSPMAGIRDLANYISLFVIPAATYGVLKHYNFQLSTWLTVVVCVYAAVAAIQWHVSQDFGLFLISDLRTTANRGITSLTPEPTFFGTVLLIFLAMAICLGQRALSAFIVAIMLYYSRSATALLILFAGIAVYGLWELFTRASLAKAAMGLAVISAIIIVGTVTLEGSRAHSLALLVIDDPLGVITADESVRTRLGFVFVSFFGAFEHGLIPHGFDPVTFLRYFQEMTSRYPDFLFDINVGTRIQSGYGKLFYQLGAAAIVFPLVVQMTLNRLSLPASTRAMLSVWIHGIFISSIAIGFPLLLFFVGFAMQRSLDAHHR